MEIDCIMQKADMEINCLHHAQADVGIDSSHYVQTDVNVECIMNMDTFALCTSRVGLGKFAS